MLQMLRRALGTALPAKANKARLYPVETGGQPAWYSRSDTGAEYPIAGLASFNGRTDPNAVPQQSDYDPFFLTPAEGNAAYQPVDTDLTAIAALSTTNYGRALLTVASAAVLTGLIALATPTTSGAMSAPDKAIVENYKLAQVNILDYAGGVVINTGANSALAAYNAAVAALPNGGTIFFPPGVYQFGNANLNLNTAHIRVLGAARYNTVILTSSTTDQILTFNQYYQVIEGFTFTGPGSGQVSSKTAGYAIDCNAANAAYGKVTNCTFTYQFNCVNIGCTLMDVEDLELRFFKNSGIVVTQNSDHRINGVTADNNAGALPTGGGIVVTATASLILDQLNIIHSNMALDVAPGAGVTVPSVKGTSCFFDTSAIGLRMASAGSFFRSEFTNCWFSSMSTAGIQFGPTTAGANVDGITFVNCDIYNNVAGTTNGVSITTANVGKWKMMGCTLAGWTNAFNLIAGNAHFPTIIGNTVGSVSAFGVNGTGFNIGAGQYKGLMILGNDAQDNTTPITIGAVTTAAGDVKNFKICDNGGINPRGAVTTPAVPATNVAVTNTTGFRVTAYIKGGVTSVVTVNGVATPSVLAAGGNLPVQLDPGGTIAVTFTTAFTWVWVAN